MFDDEEHIARARALLMDYRAGTVDLVAPDHITSEVLNSLWKGIRIGRIASAAAEAAMYEFLALDLRVAGGALRYVSAYRTAIEFDCAFYDALYVSLARDSKYQLIYADDKLRSKLLGRFEYGLWIEDYVSPRGTRVASDG